MLVEGQQLQVLEDDCSAVGVCEVHFYSIVGLATVGFWVMLSNVLSTSGFNHDDRLLSPRAMLVDFACYLFPVHAYFPKDDHVGVGCPYLFD